MATIPIMEIPVLFEIPAEIAAGLASGEFIRIGGVVRDSAGQIVIHLKEVGSGITKATPEVARAVRSRNGIVVGGVLLVVFVAGSGTALWLSRKRKAQAMRRAVACVESYDEALLGYLGAIQDQTLDVDMVDRMVSALEDLVLVSEELSDRMVVTPAVLPELLEFVVEFTKALAEANSLRPPELELIGKSKPQAAVGEMQLCLRAQREILDRAA